jgi:hypothetical protein
MEKKWFRPSKYCLIDLNLCGKFWIEERFCEFVIFTYYIDRKEPIVIAAFTDIEKTRELLDEIEKELGKG